MRINLLFALIFSMLFEVAFGQSTNISGLFKSNFSKAEKMYLQQAYRNAIDLYRLALDRDPGNRTAKARVADCYYRMGQLEEANRWYRELVKQGTPIASEYYQWGQVLSALERYDSARVAYDKASNLDPNDARVKTKIAFIDAMHRYRKETASGIIHRSQIFLRDTIKKELSLSPHATGTCLSNENR
jgi:tetratricopeptide (TPR) repeat protein